MPAPATVRVRRLRHGRWVWIKTAAPVAAHKPQVRAARPASRQESDDAQIQAQQAVEVHPNSRNYSLLNSAYALYDSGVNERLKGNYGISTDKLTEAAKLIDQASSIGRDGRPSTLSAMVFFELGQSAEADGELGLARDSYVHAVKAKPNYVEAYLRLVNVLAGAGKLREAMNWLKDGLRECPHDPSLNAMLVQLGGYMGQAGVDDVPDAMDEGAKP
ncbi:MAG: tetratricopeptide repeat protein [Cyanobacteria bacterium SZAS LIN-3]|nr:tetratricopeptide repeat protein [Cyanobacteria bacterium SZAS LIN-3]